MSQPEPAEVAGRRHRRSQRHAGPSLAALILFLLAGAAIGCGESDEERAQNEVCDARNDIQKRVNSLAGLTPSTVTADKVMVNTPPCAAS